MEGTKRDTTIDFIKAFAILGVIAIHIGSRTLTENTVGSFEWTSGLFWGSFFRASVPLFLMSSGALMLEPTKPLSVKKLYLHNILRIVVAMFVWGNAYKLFHLLMNSQLDMKNVLYSFKQILVLEMEFHFYYIYMILLVYICLPITRMFTEKADKKLLQYTLAVWFVVAIIISTVRDFSPFNQFEEITDRWGLNLTYASIGYGVLGYYLKKYPLSFKTAILCLISGFSIVFFVTFRLSWKNGILHEQFLSGASIGVCLYAIGIFSVFSNASFKGFIRSMVVYISKASFCIYLSHMFILYTAERFSITAMIGPAVLTVPLFSVVGLLISLVIYTIVSKIPVLNKWII